jgi:coenzyme F420-0:L-glutamate ligase/coenzyme F420-1:gamma-L-glutamate ligase
MSLVVVPVEGLPEIQAGDDLAALLAPALAGATWPDGSTGPAPGDIVVVTSKIVSKAEGRVVTAADREAAITDEAVRVVATRGATRIVETRHGLVMAAGGVDASNVPAGTVALLPVDPTPPRAPCAPRWGQLWARSPSVSSSPTPWAAPGGWA